MIPSILIKQLQNGLVEYLDTTFPISNELFSGTISNFLREKDKVFREPYLSVKLPFKKSEKNLDDFGFQGFNLKYTPYLHQEKAFSRLLKSEPESTLIATGTGSGKTECFTYPILEYCYRKRGEQGIKAIIIYPMNALATDQAKRLAEMVFENEDLKKTVKIGMYVGDKGATKISEMTDINVINDRDILRKDPPDILLTNYKMLDYLLTRPTDFELWTRNNSETLKFLAVDEFHTFDGAQGTDLACLLRRLKKHLGTPENYLTCVGTSATMGSDNNRADMIKFASEVFGESFSEDSIITESREKAIDFLEENNPRIFDIPSIDDLKSLENSVSQDNYLDFMAKNYKIWLKKDISIDEIENTDFRVNLSNELFNHYFFHELILATNSQIISYETLIEELTKKNAQLKYYDFEQKKVILESLLALVSHGRKKEGKNVSQFLNVHIQLWFKELRRVLATVTPEPKFDLADDINDQSLKEYLPVVNCRECGATGWAGRFFENKKLEISDLRDFYTQFFAGDKNIKLIFPDKVTNSKSYDQGYICPKCHNLIYAGELDGECTCGKCGYQELIEVFIDHQNEEKETDKKNYICPYCNSKHGLVLVGAQGSTMISAGVSELFASKYNDDKKLLTFSDSVQDASHRAGFFNARTWKFNLRVAIQQYAETLDTKPNIKEFSEGLINYLKNEYDRESFISTFIPVNLITDLEFEYLQENNKLSNNTGNIERLIRHIENRIILETYYEYGFKSRIGRTLEKSSASVLDFDQELIDKSVEDLELILKNEVGALSHITKEDVYNFVQGLLIRLKNTGAIELIYLNSMIERETTDSVFFANRPWAPAAGKDVPSFLVLSVVPNKTFAYIGKKSWYNKWVRKCLVKDSLAGQIEVYIYDKTVKLLEDNNLLFSKETHKNISVYGLKDNFVSISKDVVQVKCSKCGNKHSVSRSQFEKWNSMPCFNIHCDGEYLVDDKSSNFFGRLYSNGDVFRVFSSEHTGLQDGEAREKVEKSFKKKRDEQKRWDINLLSCTPTLEMGIDIGDLSSVLLCSVPPTQAQFMQRIGRPGRRDGNAISAVVTNAEAHDLYFYEDPMEMLAGNIKPPTIFLNASAVLERQFTAFCFDNWIKRENGKNKVPKELSLILNNVEKKNDLIFPYNFLKFIRMNLTSLLKDFLYIFSKDLSDNSKERIRAFAQGKDNEEGNIDYKIICAFKGIREERESIKKEIDKLKKEIDKLKEKPLDESTEKEINDLKSLRENLQDVVKNINTKNLYNFLSDEGLLPNYAFPEAGIILKSFINRKFNKGDDKNLDKGFKRYIYEYNRPANSAISEFAPGNSFYAEGRKVTIDRIDLNVSKKEFWRLCPDCSHSEIDRPELLEMNCPKCGSSAWRDKGQIKSLVKLKQVYSTEDYENSKTGDESDRRDTKYFVKRLFVGLNEEKDILNAFQIEDENCAFGFEFVKNALLREINFGEKLSIGNGIKIAGRVENVKGFEICKECGKVQSNPKKPNHTYTCSLKNKEKEEAVEEALYLYREFNSEAIRILIPATSMEENEQVLQSFIAGISLGLKKYFGSVEHIKTAITQEPIKGTELLKNYLVIYDSVPGGTGYLKDLMKSEDDFFSMIKAGYDAMQNCSCSQNIDKDGCYQCLYAYKQSRQIGYISRQTAIETFNQILNSRNKVKKIKSISNISINSLFDSELEKKFIEALKRAGKQDRQITIKPEIYNNKQGYRLKIKDNTWMIEPQVELGKENGVEIKCKPDFIIYPRNEKGRPIAVFTDGFEYHKDIVHEDLKKRMALIQSGKYIVWSLSWNDVENEFLPQQDYYKNAFESSMFKSNPLIGKLSLQETVESISKKTSFQLLLDVLEDTNKIDKFKQYSFAYSFGFISKNDLLSKSNVSIYLEESFNFDTSWITANLNDKVFYKLYEDKNLGIIINIKIDIETQKMNTKNDIIFDDVSVDSETKEFSKKWNGLLKLLNILQFQENNRFISLRGIENSYQDLFKFESIVEKPNAEISSDWEEVLEQIFDEQIKDIAIELAKYNLDLPFVGFELDDDGEIIAEAELAWEEKSLVILTEEQLGYKSTFEAKNYLVFDGSSILDDILKALKN